MMIDKKKPFSVRTVDDVAVKGYESMEDAERSAAERNNRAEAMGLQARYEATDKPA